MADLDLVAPQTTVSVSFSVEPAYNVLCTLYLLNTEQSGLGQWITQTVGELSAETLETNRHVCPAATSHLRGHTWASFPAWLDDLEARDPVAMRDLELTELRDAVSEFLGEEDSPKVPSADELLSNAEVYLSLMARVSERKGEAFDRDHHAVDHDLLNDPPARQKLITGHLRRMWADHVSDEWDRNLEALKDSVAAFQSLEYPEMSALETVCRVTQRDQSPPAWERCLAGVERIVFVPSTHIGPYLVLMDCQESVARIVMRARIPKGATVTSHVLDRSELLMRMQALSDDTRLRILELLARKDELTAQDVMSELGLSQSSASRHLSQLGATGYLSTRRHDGANRYSLHQNSIDEVFGGIRDFFRGAYDRRAPSG